MRSFTRFMAALTCCVALAGLLTGPAQASGGGSGGGGVDTTSTAPPLFFDYIASVGGVAPSCTGDCTLTNSIPGYYTWTTVQINLKAKPLNLPDNTALTVTIYTSDKVTGEVYAPVRMAPLVVLSKTGISKSTVNILNPTSNSVVRQVDHVIVTAADGTVIMSAHP